MEVSKGGFFISSSIQWQASRGLLQLLERWSSREVLDHSWTWGPCCYVSPSNWSVFVTLIIINHLHIFSYPKDELNSINKQVCLSPSTAILVDEFIEHPAHIQIQCSLVAPKSIGPSEIAPSVAIIRASSSPDVPLKRVPRNSQKFRPKFVHHQLDSNPRPIDLVKPSAM